MSSKSRDSIIKKTADQGINIDKLNQGIKDVNQKIVKDKKQLGEEIKNFEKLNENSTDISNSRRDENGKIYDRFCSGKDYYEFTNKDGTTYLVKYHKDGKNNNLKLFDFPQTARPTIETLLDERIRPESLCENLINNSSYSYKGSKKSIKIKPLDTTGGKFGNGEYIPKVYEVQIEDKNGNKLHKNYILIGAHKLKSSFESGEKRDRDISEIAINYLNAYDAAAKKDPAFNEKKKLVLFKRGRDVEIKDIDEYGYLRDYLDTFINNYQTKESQTSEPVTQPSETPASPQPSQSQTTSCEPSVMYLPPGEPIPLLSSGEPTSQSPNQSSSNLESKVESGKETKDDNAIYSELYKCMYDELEKEHDKLKEQYSNLEKKIKEYNETVIKLIEFTKEYKTLTDKLLQKVISNSSKEANSLEGKPQSSQSQTTQLPKKSISDCILNALNKSNELDKITYIPINNKNNNKDYDIVCKFDFKEGKKVVSTSNGGYDNKYIGFIGKLGEALSEYYSKDLYQETLGKVLGALKEDEGLKNQLKDIDVKSVNIKIGKFENSEDYYIKDLYIERDNSGFFGFFRKLFGKGYLKLDYDLGRANLYFENVNRDIAENYTNTRLKGYQRNLFENLTSSQSSGSTQSQTTQPSQNQEQRRRPPSSYCQKTLDEI